MSMTVPTVSIPMSLPTPTPIPPGIVIDNGEYLLNLGDKTACMAGIGITIALWALSAGAAILINWLITRRERHDNERQEVRNTSSHRR
jgi:hypothetical protein